MPQRRRRPPRPGALADLAPLRIFKQILLLQISYYATAVVLLVFTVLAAGKHMSPDLLFGWGSLRGDITEGWMLGLVWMLNSLIRYGYCTRAKGAIQTDSLQRSVHTPPHRPLKARP